MANNENHPGRIILRQLGGLTLQLLGARNYLLLDDPLPGVQFNIVGSSNVNKIQILLDPSDTYTIRFWKVSKRLVPKTKLVTEREDIFVDSLHEVIERVTGLCTTFKSAVRKQRQASYEEREVHVNRLMVRCED